MTISALAPRAWILAGALAGLAGTSPRPLHPEEPFVRLGTTAFRHASGIQVIQISPDGKLLASGGRDAWVRIWELPEGREVGSHHLDAEVSGLAFSSDGRTLLCAGRRSELRVLSLPTGREVERLPIPVTSIRSIASSPRADLWAAGGDGTLLVWDSKTKTAPKAVGSPQGPVAAVAFSPDGKFLAAGGDEETVLLWALPELGEPVRMAGPKFGKIRSLAFLPDERTLAAGCQDSAVRLWDLAKRTLTATLATSGAVTSLCPSPDGRILAAACGRPVIHLWEAGSGKELLKIDTHCREIGTLCFSADGKTLLTGSDQAGIGFWDASSGRRRTDTLESHLGRVGALAVSPSGGRLASGGQDGTVCLWNLGEYTLLSKAGEHENPVLSLSFSPDGKTLVSGSAEALCLWDAESGALRRRIKDPSGGLVVRGVFMDGGKTLAVATSDSRIDAWNALTGDRISILAEREGPVTSLLYSEAAHRLLWADHGGAISMLGTAAREGIRRMKSPRGPVLSLSLSPDERTLSSGGGDGDIRVWNLDRGKPCLQMVRGSGFVRSLAHSPDGRLLASVGEDSTVRLWELATGNLLSSLSHEDGPPLSAVFTRDGKQLAVGMARCTVVLWNLPAVIQANRAAVPSDRTPVERLESEDPLTAYQAMESLIREPQEAVQCLRKLLLPMSVDPNRVSRLLENLEDDSADVRKKAQAELEWIAPPEAIRAAMARQTVPEVHERLEEILASQFEPKIRWARGVLVLRALQVLERIPLPAAEELLQLLAEGPESRGRREALLALGRQKRESGR